MTKTQEFENLLNHNCRQWVNDFDKKRDVLKSHLEKCEKELNHIDNCVTCCNNGILKCRKLAKIDKQLLEDSKK